MKDGLENESHENETVSTCVVEWIESTIISLFSQLMSVSTCVVEWIERLILSTLSSTLCRLHLCGGVD